MTKTSILVFAGAVTIACARATGPAQPTFGAEYRILLEPDPPALEAATLAVTVSYGGCSNNRQFALEHRVLPELQIEVWLRKVTPDESCDRLVTERRVFSVHQRVRDAADVVLLTPDGDRYRLRP